VALRFQFFLSLLILSFILLGSLMAGARFEFLPQVQEIESKGAETDLQRGVEAIYRELFHLERLVRTMVNSVSFTQYIEKRNNDYVSVRFPDAFFTENQIQVIFILDLHKNVVWSHVLDPSSTNQMQLPDFEKEVEAANPAFVAFDSALGVQSGIFLSERGPMMLAASPIYDLQSQVVNGTLLIGRFFTEDILNTLVGQTWVNLQIWPFFNRTMPAPQQSILNELAKNNNFMMVHQGSHRFRAYSALEDISGIKPLLIAAMIDSPVGELTDNASTLTCIAILAGFLLMLFSLMVMLQRRVFSPLKKIKKAAQDIGEQRAWDKKVGEPSLDEVGELIQTLNQAFHTLFLRHKAEVKAAQEQGRAEMGTHVMNNIRRGLPSVVEDLQQLEQKIQHFPVINFDRLVAEIASCPDTSVPLLALMERLLIENQHLHELQKHLQTKLGSVKGKTERVVTATRVSTLRFAPSVEKKK